MPGTPEGSMSEGRDAASITFVMRWSEARAPGMCRAARRESAKDTDEKTRTKKNRHPNMDMAVQGGTRQHQGHVPSASAAINQAMEAL